ncbi:uncharacterized protein LOC132717127 [Ruditapes philippinarum]|uniref:uncharacterized protein LOC132717127 n=1 Tax=Ruditapes philippinarum TaxID=129788 RepID=UPI00295A7D3E|nr:uncharacterized protein LOC132717127 [Ruditapes philippinarum]
MDITPRLIVYSFVLESFTLLLCHGQLENMGMLALMGGGGMGGMTGGMSAGLGMGIGGMSSMEYATLDNAVKAIVGPHASPDMALINYATQQGGSPRGFMQMMGYIPFLQNIARTVGIRPVPGDTQNNNVAQNSDSIIMQRSVRWMRNNGLLFSAGGAMF